MQLRQGKLFFTSLMKEQVNHASEIDTAIQTSKYQIGRERGNLHTCTRPKVSRQGSIVVSGGMCILQGQTERTGTGLIRAIRIAFVRDGSRSRANRRVGNKNWASLNYTH